MKSYEISAVSCRPAGEPDFFGSNPSTSLCFAQLAGKSTRREMPIPRGRFPATAASTMSGARKASEIIICTERLLRPSRAAIVTIRKTVTRRQPSLTQPVAQAREMAFNIANLVVGWSAKRMLLEALRVNPMRRPSSARGWARSAFTFFFLLTFLLQGYATQTHIHPPVASSSGISDPTIGFGHLAKVSGSQQRDHDGAPAKDGSDTCPLCQEILIAGAYVWPPLPVLPTPSVSTAIASFAPTAAAVSRAISHSWHGRAPPSNELHIMNL